MSAGAPLTEYEKLLWCGLISLADLRQEGVPIAGIRVHYEAGFTYDNIAVPAGTVEVFGREVHFSQTGENYATPDPATEPTRPTYSGLTIDTTTPTMGGTITVSATVKSPFSIQRSMTVPLLVDGRVAKDKVITLSPGQSQSVSFTYRETEARCHDMSIGNLPATQVCWLPPQLQM